MIPTLHQIDRLQLQGVNADDAPALLRDLFHRVTRYVGLSAVSSGFGCKVMPQEFSKGQFRGKMGFDGRSQPPAYWPAQISRHGLIAYFCLPKSSHNSHIMRARDWAAVVTQKMHSLGWNEVTVDYHSLHIEIACLETDTKFKNYISTWSTNSPIN